jgi:menaquinone-specific isochorismate synthase
VRVSDHVELVKLPHIQHILRTIEGDLGGGESDLEILRALHPTPAVGGYPADLALNAIKELEPFERGWYAGPVGWVGPDAAEFAVAIRSGLVSGNTLSLYSGAGIVPGSRPEAEWDEIENKTRTFLGVLQEEQAP